MNVLRRVRVPKVDPEAASFRCTGCGACCSEFWINVSAADVARICDATGLSAIEVVEFTGEHLVDGEDDDDGWVLLGDTRSLMTLKTAPDERVCQFLVDGLCSIYEARPRACRLYPWDRDWLLGGHRSHIRLEILTDDCPYETDGNVDIKTLLGEFDADDRERDAFEEHLAEWEELGAPDDPIRFLQFVGLPLERREKR